MKLSDVLDPIRKIAPMIAGAVGGPYASVAVSALSNIILGKPDGTEEEVVDVLSSGNPEVLFKLKQAEEDFKIKMKELGIKEDELIVEDRMDAREREIKTKDKMVPIFAGIVLLGFFATVGYVLSGYVDLSGQTGAIAGTLIGYVSAKAEQVIAYYFGSSKGSSDKNNIFNDLINKKWV